MAAVCALIGTAVFLRVLRAVPLRDPLVVPLIGLMLPGWSARSRRSSRSVSTCSSRWRLDAR